jgi:ribosomal protein S18 acetylase RimI-like enzyme
MEDKYSIVEINDDNSDILDSMSNKYRYARTYYERQCLFGTPESAFILYGKEYIGFVKWAFYNGRVEINYFMIKDVYQGKGYGKKAFNEVITHIRGLYPDIPITLIVELENKAAVKIYLANGFNFMVDVSLPGMREMVLY